MEKENKKGCESCKNFGLCFILPSMSQSLEVVLDRFTIDCIRNNYRNFTEKED